MLLWGGKQTVVKMSQIKGECNELVWVFIKLYVICSRSSIAREGHTPNTYVWVSFSKELVDKEHGLPTHYDLRRQGHTA